MTTPTTLRCRPFRSLMVANRGEIAIRILRACREMGVRGIAVYSEADRHAPHVEHADEAICIGPAPAPESYLNVDALLRAARATGAEAIHPGYGFLSERAAFAQAVEDAGLVFVGPPHAAIALLGDKVRAREAMRRLGVPLVPGAGEVVVGADAARRLVDDIGMPLLVKAAGGGGGKGIRIVRDPADFDAAFRQASAEAAKAFGNPALFLERFVDPARHIEIQIIGDSHGNVVHLGERECTVQRRFQKLVEEAPSAFVSPAMRREMGETAARAARELGYASAGTFEFVVDAEGRYYFLEVNTRLQVEHPVTELVTGIDLVREMIRVAMGEPLSDRALAYAADPKPNGHAIECRINAEDPRNGFAPSTGRITRADLPSGAGVRLDHALRAGGEVAMHYDSMVGKLIVHAATRDEAIARLQRALRECSIAGVATTLPFHAWLAAHPRFATNDVHTRFVEQEFRPEALDDGVDEELYLAAAAALAHAGALGGAPAVAPPVKGEAAAGVGSAWAISARRTGVGGGL